MKLLIAAVFILLQSAQTAPGGSVAGVWEGSSLCTVPGSPCHNEHVVYHIQPEGAAPTKFRIDANKIVNGQEDFMGTLHCSYAKEKKELFCDTSGDWRFAVEGDAITGTLHLKDGTLYRKINVSRRK